jgi:hypothetical protein
MTQMVGTPKALHMHDREVDYNITTKHTVNNSTIVVDDM